MEKLDVEIIPQFGSIDECQKFLDSLTEKLNKMEKFIEKNLPVSRVVNGFRIKPFEFSSGFCWFITPNNSTRSFYFTTLSLAEDFCHNYVNHHSESYWYRLWLKSPIYHRLNVKKVVDLISSIL